MDRKEARRLTKVEGQPVFLWVGRLNENKDPLTVVRSFIEFLSWQPAARLYMIFQTEELLPQVNDVIKKNRGTAKSIHLVGNVPHGQLGSWHNSADFFISASHYEGGGAAVVEAMSCGCIPILTNIDAFAGLTGGGKCGFLFKPGDEKGLLTALLKTREINLETEREKVQEQYRNELSFEAIGKKIRAILATL
jgi:glycosyltransferase involved in cell wall biosynthesis